MTARTNARRQRAHPRVRDAGRLAAGTRRFRGRALVITLVELPLVLPPAVAGIGAAGGVRRRRACSATELARRRHRAAVHGVGGGARGRRSSPRRSTSARRSRRSRPSTRRSPTPRARSAPSPARTFWRIALPLAAGGLLAGWVLAFARGVGEFGATIVFAGSVQGETQTLTLAIYEQLDANFDVALAIGDPARRAQRGGAAVVQGAVLVESARARHRPRASHLRARPPPERRRGDGRARRAVGRGQDDRAARDRRAAPRPTAGASRSARDVWFDARREVDLPPERALGRPRLPGVRAVPAPDRARATSPSAARPRASTSCSSACGIAQLAGERPGRALGRRAPARRARARARPRPAACCCSTSRCRRSMRTRARRFARELQDLLAAARPADAARHPRLRRRDGARRPHRRDRRRAPAPARHGRRAHRVSPRRVRRNFTGGNVLAGEARRPAAAARSPRCRRGRALGQGRAGASPSPSTRGRSASAARRRPRRERLAGRVAGLRRRGPRARADGRVTAECPAEELERLGLRRLRPRGRPSRPRPCASWRSTTATIGANGRALAP